MASRGFVSTENGWMQSPTRLFGCSKTQRMQDEWERMGAAESWKTLLTSDAWTSCANSLCAAATLVRIDRKYARASRRWREGCRIPGNSRRVLLRRATV